MSPPTTETSSRQTTTTTTTTTTPYQIQWSNVSVRKQIGKGTFCNVYQVDYSSSSYALKCIDVDRINSICGCSNRNVAAADNNDNDDSITPVQQAITDLVTEGNVLSKLDHDNIIKLHGVAATAADDAAADDDERHFLLLELLQEDTLKDCMKQWKKNQTRKSLFFFNYVYPTRW